MNDHLRKIQKRAVSYWFVDGLAELAMGVLGLMIAVVFWFWEYLFTGRWNFLIIFGVLLALSVGLRLLIQRVKERSTYPRTGYVAPASGLESRASVLVAVVFMLLVFALNIFLTLSGQEALLWSPAVAGLIFAFVLGWAGVSTGLRRLYLVAGISFAAGVTLSLLGIEYMKAVGVLSAVAGLITLIQGILVYRDYHRQNPVSSP